MSDQKPETLVSHVDCTCGICGVRIPAPATVLWHRGDLDLGITHIDCSNPEQQSTPQEPTPQESTPLPFLTHLAAVCKTCGGDCPKGTEVLWHPELGVITHTDCPAPTMEAEETKGHGVGPFPEEETPVLTVGDLKRALADVPDDAQVLVASRYDDQVQTEDIALNVSMNGLDVQLNTVDFQAYLDCTK